MPTQTELDALESFGLDLSDLTLDRSTFIGILKDRYRLFALDMHPEKNLNNPQATRIYQRMQSQYVVLLELAESLTANPSQAEQGTGEPTFHTIYEIWNAHTPALFIQVFPSRN